MLTEKSIPLPAVATTKFPLVTVVSPVKDCPPAAAQAPSALRKLVVPPPNLRRRPCLEVLESKSVLSSPAAKSSI